MKIGKINLRKFLNKELLALGLTVLIGSFLRLQGVLTNSFAYTYDVGRDMIALWNIVVNHDLVFIGATTGIQGVFYGPWWYYMLVPFFVLFGGDPSGIALTMSLVGILSIVLAFIIGKKIGNTFLAIIFSLLVSVSPNLVSHSTQIWNPNIAPFFVLLVFFALFKIYTLEKNNKYFLLLGLFLAINIDLEILWGILLTLGIFISQAFILKRKIKLKQIAFLFIGALVIAAPRLLFEIKHGFLMSKSLITFILSKNTLEDPLTFRQLLENRVSSYFDLFSSSLAFNNQIVAVVLIVFIVVALFLFYKKASDVIKKFIITLVTVLVVFFVGTIIFSHALWPHYLVGLPVVFILLFSISLYLLSFKTKNLIIPYFILIVLSVINFNPLREIKNVTQASFAGDASVYRNQLEVVDYVYRESQGKDFKYVVYTPPVHDYTYRYLFMWYGPKTYKYSPNEEARTAFFIIEPDPGYEDRPKWFLEARKNDGKIIKSKILKSGVVIQTRVH
ncbi:MAG: glycosyltransferase family 39 protein [Candidatus Levybacteria bacterium]|nr:glycosyltransferase family 39 protein [Candidatus Levybacteria bacterium]